MKLLEGAKVRLRALENQDIDLLLKWENDTSLWQVSGTTIPFSRDALERYIENAHQSIYEAGQYRFLIENSSTNEAIGTLDLFEFDAFHKRAGIGILIADLENRRLGYAKESLSLIKEYCFDFLDLQMLYCNILADNEKSLKLFEKSGFEISGKKINWIRDMDQFKDEFILQLLK